jgi:pyruvyl transferase EpsO
MNYIEELHRTLRPLIDTSLPIALLDFPNYANVGDSAIWLGEKRYLEMIGVDRHVMIETYSNRQRLPSLSPETTILIQGGGNLGDLWLTHQSYREAVVRRYRRNRIIQLPQSIHFSNPYNFNKAKSIFNGHPDFHLLVRDTHSLSIAKDLYSGPTYLCPDMALVLDELQPSSLPIHKLYGLLRTDKEGALEPVSALSHIPHTDWSSDGQIKGKSLAFKLEDIEDQYNFCRRPMRNVKRVLYDWLAKQRLARGISILSLGEVIITDRLHAHLICSMMRRPHVILDNSYKKITNFQKTWKTGENISVFASTLDEAIDAAVKLVD